MSIRSLSIAAASVAVIAIPTAASSAAKSCTSEGGFKITKRHHVTCAEAKKVTKAETAGKKLPAGWKCTKGQLIIPEGKCKKGTKSFHYGM